MSRLYATPTAGSSNSYLKLCNHGMPAAPTLFKPVVLNVFAEGSQTRFTIL